MYENDQQLVRKSKKPLPGNWKFIVVSFKYPCFVVDPLTGNIIGNFDDGIAPTLKDNKPVKGKISFLDWFTLHSVPNRESWQGADQKTVVICEIRFCLYVYI